MKRPFLQRGFTIPELLVSLFIFSLVIVGAGGLLVSGISVQRRSGVQQELIDQASYLAEYMSRAMRQARKEGADSPSNCLTGAGRGFNYELNPGGDRIRFLNRNNLCQQFFLSGTQIFEQTSTDATAANFGSQVALTSNNLQAARLAFFISGEGQEDNLQPKATVAIELRGKMLQAGGQPVMQIQTTVSQRKIDVPE
jgi:prepilin-type N-terminal cleavage/methylation domain-containing protein